jgi:hypothetical protein
MGLGTNCTVAHYKKNASVIRNRSEQAPSKQEAGFIIRQEQKH